MTNKLARAGFPVGTAEYFEAEPPYWQKFIKYKWLEFIEPDYLHTIEGGRIPINQGPVNTPQDVPVQKRYNFGDLLKDKNEPTEPYQPPKQIEPKPIQNHNFEQYDYKHYPGFPDPRFQG